MSERTAIILDHAHWRAAQQRRAKRLAAIERDLRLPMARRPRLTLDEILGPTSGPPKGVA